LGVQEYGAEVEVWASEARRKRRLEKSKIFEPRIYARLLQSNMAPRK